jgi:hypothetical protein
VLAHGKAGGAKAVKAPRPAKAERAPKAPEGRARAAAISTAARRRAAHPARVPALLDGARLELGIAAERLRAAGLRPESAVDQALQEAPPHFALSPEKQPNKVQFIGDAG